jgi:hypothetical protein
MNGLETLVFWLIVNIPIAFVIFGICYSKAQIEKRYVLFYPRLIESLRDRLNIPGTIIATVVISIIIAPVILMYFIYASLAFMCYLIFLGFIKIFERKD